MGARDLRLGGIGTLMQHQLEVVIEHDEDGFYVASVPQLRGCHTQAQSLDDLIERVREAIVLWLETAGGPVRELQFIGIQQITVAG